jgi:hypothetical protein
MRCSADGVGFAMLMSCASDALCNAAQGRCDTPACRAGELSCSGDSLRECSVDQTSFREVMRCKAGLCDARAGICLACQPSSVRCEGNTLVQCTTDGGSEQRYACEGNTPYCRGSECVACLSSSDCDSPGECSAVTCSSAGECIYGDAPRGTACSPRTAQGAGMPGLCVGGLAGCQACGNDSDCRRLQPSKPFCFVITSSSSSQQVDGYCLECRSATDCPANYFCRYEECVANGS